MCPVIASYVQVLFDRMPPPVKATLAKYGTAISKTESDATVQQRRAYIAADYAVRCVLPIAMALRGFSAETIKRLQASECIVDVTTATQAAQLAGQMAGKDDALYCAYAASMAASIATHPENAAYAADAAGYAFYLGAAAIGGESNVFWEMAMDCLEDMVMA